MRAVHVHLDAGLGVGLAVGVAAEVVAALEDEDLQAELVGAALGDGESEEAGADDDEVGVSDRQTPEVGAPGVRTAAVSLRDGPRSARRDRAHAPRASAMARITLPASARPPRTGLSSDDGER